MSGRFHFIKSWGAEPVDGGARFRLWAPAHETMALRAHGSGRDLPMQEAGDGWFDIVTDAVRPGEGYSFVLPDGMAVADPAARAQIGDVHGPSRMVDPTAFEWQSAGWQGRPWEETVFYELHVGAFSPEGTFDGVQRRLDHLADIGVTAIELMPVAQFGGNRGWGYDGVLLYAPHVAYGGPEGLKRLVDAAHQRELMVFLDVVYNHFGPDGNYLHLYAPDFFHAERHTPWGSAIAYEKPAVRAFFIENALYWLEEYRLDGLRLDAVDQIDDQSDEALLEELALTVRRRFAGRHVHLTTEDDRNIVSLHERAPDGSIRLYSAEWNDDVHHAVHVIATGEDDGYYCDYSRDPADDLARALATGFVYQGEPSPYRDDAPRGHSSAHLPPTAFVDFLQNHDQVGNRAFNERLAALAEPEIVASLTAMLLLSPHIPLLFMGEEWGETRPFGFFTDFHGELGDLVREGRRREFAKWAHFSREESRELIADPNAQATFDAARLDWDKLDQPEHRERLKLVRSLLAARGRDIVPRLSQIGGNAGTAERLGEKAFGVTWRLSEGGALMLYANLGSEELVLSPSGESALPPPLWGRAGVGVASTSQRHENEVPGRVIFAHPNASEDAFRNGALLPLAVVSLVQEGTHFVPLPE